MSPRQDKHLDLGPLHPPRPVVDTDDDDLTSIPRLLTFLGQPIAKGELGDTPHYKSLVLKWLATQRRNDIRPHPHLIMGLRVRQWINEDRFEELWGWVTTPPADV